MANIVHTLRSTGVDNITVFGSIQTWWNQECATKDFVTDQDTITLECYDDWPTGKVETVSLVSGVGYAANGTYFPKITTATGEGHGGIGGQGFFLTNAADYVQCFQATAAYLIVDGMRYYSSGIGSPIFDTYPTAAQTMRFQNCIAEGNLALSSVGFRLNRAQHHNLLAIGPERGFDVYEADNDQYAIRNSGAVDCTYGFVMPGGAFATLENCFAYNCTDSYFNVPTTANNLAASDGATETPPGTNPYTSNVVSGDFVNAAGDDYHLSVSSGLLGQGINRFAFFTEDIDGDPYPSAPTAWPIGFDTPATAGAIDGEFDETLGAATLSSDGEVAIDGSFDETLGAATLSSDGEVAISGDLDETLDDLTVDSDGSVVPAGNVAVLDVTFEELTLSSDGEVEVTADGDIALDAATVNSEGSLDLVGTLDSTLDGVGFTSEADLLIDGSLNSTLDSVGFSATANDLSPIEGDATFTMDGVIFTSEVLVTTPVDPNNPVCTDTNRAATININVGYGGPSIIPQGVIDASERRIVAGSYAFEECAGLVSRGGGGSGGRPWVRQPINKGTADALLMKRIKREDEELIQIVTAIAKSGILSGSRPIQINF